jgi:uncharacterized protein YceK
MRVLVLAVLAALPVLGGCAASNNLFRGDSKVYGGTRLDATLVSEGFGTDEATAKEKKLERSVLTYEGFCGLVDMPLSFVADTAMLPITVPVTLAKNAQKPHNGKRSPKDDDDNAADDSADE